MEYLENYKGVTESIDIYTSYDNPIKVDEITNKIKSYGNESGFNNDVF